MSQFLNCKTLEIIWHSHYIPCIEENNRKMWNEPGKKNTLCIWFWTLKDTTKATFLLLSIHWLQLCLQPNFNFIYNTPSPFSDNELKINQKMICEILACNLTWCYTPMDQLADNQERWSLYPHIYHEMAGWKNLGLMES